MGIRRDFVTSVLVAWWRRWHWPPRAVTTTSPWRPVGERHRELRPLDAVRPVCGGRRTQRPLSERAPVDSAHGAHQAGRNGELHHRRVPPRQVRAGNGPRRHQSPRSRSLWGPTRPPLINDPTNRVYRGLDPSRQPTQDRVELVVFPNPGRYLVIRVQPHFVDDNIRLREGVVGTKGSDPIFRIS